MIKGFIGTSLIDYPEKDEDEVNCSQNKNNKEWETVVSPKQYFPGCMKSSWYRASEGSIMLALSYHYFNSVSLKTVNRTLDIYTYPIYKAEESNLTIKNPKENQILEGQFYIQGEIKNQENIVYLNVFANDRLYTTIYPEKWSSVMNANFNLLVDKNSIFENCKDSAEIKIIQFNALGKAGEGKSVKVHCK